MGRLHVRPVFGHWQRIQRCRSSDRAVSPHACMRWWRDFELRPRLCRYKVRTARRSRLKACRSMPARWHHPQFFWRVVLVASPLRSPFCLRISVHRCGMCDIGYFRLSEQCVECGSASLVQFLSRAVPAFAVGGLTVFFFWGGTSRFFASSCHRLGVGTVPASPLSAPTPVLRVSCSSFRQPITRYDSVSRYGEWPTK